jgi:hypothetical protein
VALYVLNENIQEKAESYPNIRLELVKFSAWAELMDALGCPGTIKEIIPVNTERAKRFRNSKESDLIRQQVIALF